MEMIYHEFYFLLILIKIDIIKNPSVIIAFVVPLGLFLRISPYGTSSCSASQSCSGLCDRVDCSTPGFPVLHRLLEFAQTHVR